VTAYLRPTAPIAPDLLLVADPGLAMTLAQLVIAKPLMSNHHHGLWGYSGRTEAGLELTVQATGAGAPSAAAVLGELAAYGARRVVYVCRCAALELGPAPGDLVVVAAALGEDGVSRALGAGRSAPDPDLTRALAATIEAREVIVASFDLPATAAGAQRRASWQAGGAEFSDLETAALLAVGRRLELAIAAALVVDPTAAGDAGEVAVEAGLLALGRAAVTVLERAAEIAPASPAPG
jgi:uridine phosphorylase